MRRVRAQRLFVLFSLVAMATGVGVVALGQVLLIQQVAVQEERNAFIKEELGKLDQKINEIKQLKEKTQGLLERKNVVERLQSNRGESVLLFTELARQIPEGLYLKSVKQVNDSLALSGYAQSSARVATFMRSLESSSLFMEPLLGEVRGVSINNIRASEFSLNVKFQHVSTDSTKNMDGNKP
jgi:type IV pilus assembly protein PilN